MELEDFAARYPVLFHLADADSWPSIQQSGLLSSREIARRWGVPDADRDLLLRHRRPESVSLRHPKLGAAVLRDQRPLSEERLAPVLTGGMTVSDWLWLLNGFVFLFPDEASLRTLHAAYSDRDVVVLRIRTRSLISHHGSSVRVAGINTGNTMRRPAPRGQDTFLPIGRFDHSKRKVKEVAVLSEVGDLAEHLLAVEEWPAVSA